MPRHRRSRLALPFLLAVTAVGAQQPDAWDPKAILAAERFVRPPEAIERIVMTPRVDIRLDRLNADRTWALRTTGADRGAIAAYGAPHIYLGGLNLDLRANRARELMVSTRTGLVVVDPRTGTTRPLQTPAGATISSETWSPRGDRIAYIANFPTASHAYVADVASGRSTQVTRTPLLATLVDELRFTADGAALVAVLVPEGRGPMPTHGADGIEDGPRVRQTGGRKVPQPVHWSLLEDPHDQALLRWATTGQLAIVDLASRRERRIGAPTMIRAVDIAPDGTHLRVTRMTEPFSYLVPVSSFGGVQELWDLTGRVVATLQTTPLREGSRGADAPTAPDTGKRNLQWDPAGRGLLYLKSVFAATTGGEGRGGARGGRPQATAVRLMRWAAPYGPGDTSLVLEGGPQLSAFTLSHDASLLFVTDSGQTFAVRPAEPTKRFALGRGITIPGGGGGFGGGGFGGGSPSADTIGTGGTLLTRAGLGGLAGVQTTTDGRAVFVSGQRTYGADWHRRAPRPYVDRIEIETGARTRVLDAPADVFERLVAPLDDDLREVLVTRQSPTVIEDTWRRDTRTGTLTRLTTAVDAAPQVTQAVRKLIRVTRPRDGLQIWTKVVLPRTYQAGVTPGVLWFYPREHTSIEAYEKTRWSTNINTFPAVPASRPATATEVWVAAGYVFVEPDLPILGDSGRMNDNYTRDLKESLDAVIDALVDSGFVRRDNLGLGGHSYGAFSTVNAMTLVPYFKAGIAGDGMYNRSLTPFGFQSERRSFYEAQATYLDMSPFFRADKLSGALLLYHHLEDQNTGTAPMSSIRMFNALQGLGKTAALYLYPYEDHSVMTYASDLDQWARWIAWFDTHLTGARPER